MPSKSEKCLLDKSLKKEVSLPLVTFAAAAMAVLSAAPAQATITVSAINPTNASNPIRGTGTVFHYANCSPTGGWTVGYNGCTASGTNWFLDTTNGFGYIDTTKTLINDSTRSNIIWLDIKSDKAATTGYSPKLKIKVAKDSGASVDGGTQDVPIAYANGEYCNNGSNQSYCTDYSSTYGFNFSVNYAQGSTIRIGIYPKDICTNYELYSNNNSAAGSYASGCDTTYHTVSNPGSGYYKTMLLTAYVDLGNGTTDTMSFSLRFYFDAATTAYSCAVTPASIYFPGDSMLILDTSNFSTVSSSYAAPMAAVLGVANRMPTAVTLGSTYASSNSIVNILGIGSGVQMVGFENADIAGASYNVGFMPRDSTGIVYVDAVSSTFCSMSNVQTAGIEGFLKKSKCFIATGAFRSIDAAPVAMLRNFRDKLLSQSELGRAFIDWYYDWSPKAALWLMEHPAFRYPVLLALIPVQVVAWSALNPLWALAALGAYAGLLFALFVCMRSGRKERA